MRLSGLYKGVGGVLALLIAVGGNAELLTLERDGATQIMAKIWATMNMESVQQGRAVPWEFSYQAKGEDKIVSILSPLPLKIRREGSDMTLTTYNVQVNNSAAFLTVDEDSMKLSYSGLKGENGVHYQASFSENSAEETVGMPEHPPQSYDQGHDIDIEVEPPQEFLPTQAEINTAATVKGNVPIIVYVFKHNDVIENESALVHEHFTWWAKQMEAIKKRHQGKGGASLFSELIVDFVSDPEIQSFEYKGDPKEKIKELANMMRRYKNQHAPGGSYRRTKFLLLTEKMMNWQTLGIAYVGGQYGMAADDDDQVAAHEIGHMFNGRHDKADVIYNGWWCETILYWQHVFLRAGCHRYTDANMDIIADYLD